MLGTTLMQINTGELLSFSNATQQLPKRYKTHKVTAYIGVDIPHPNQCKDSSSLLASVKQLDPYFSQKIRLSIEYPYLTDCVVKGLMSPKMVGQFLALLDCLVAWNIGFTTKSELLCCCGITGNNYAALVKSLNPYVKIETLHPTDKQSLKLLFNPVVVWKGCKVTRQDRIARHYNLHQ